MKLISENKDLLVISFGKILQILISLLSLRLVTELLPTRELGLYYLLLSATTFFSFSLMNPVGQFYSRYILKWKSEGNLLNATIALFFYRVVAIVFSLLIVFIIIYFELYEYDDSGQDVFLFFLLFLMAGIHGVLISVINYLGFRIKFVIFTLSTAMISLASSYLLLNIYSATAINWLYGIAITQIFFSILMCFFIFKDEIFSIKKIREKLNCDDLKKVCYFAIPVALTLLLQWGQNSSYRFIVESKYSLETLGELAVGFSVSAAVFKAVEAIVTQYFNPIYLKAITNSTVQERVAAWEQLSSKVIPIYVLLLFFTIASAPYLVKLLVSSKFQDVYLYTMLGAIIEFLRVSTNVVYLISQSEVKTKTTIVPYLAGVILMYLGLEYIDINNVALGVSLVLILSSVITIHILYYNMKKILLVKFHVSCLLKPLLFSIAFIAMLQLDVTPTIQSSVIITFILGVYFIYASSHFILRKSKT